MTRKGKDVKRKCWLAPVDDALFMLTNQAEHLIRGPGGVQMNVYVENGSLRADYRGVVSNAISDGSW